MNYLCKKTKRDETPLNEEEINSIRELWEKDNFAQMNIWCQSTRCNLDISVTEIEFQRKFRTDIVIIDQCNLLSTEIKSHGFGKNKKESKTQAMRAIMNRLIETDNMITGMKSKSYYDKNINSIKQNNDIELTLRNPNKLFKLLINNLSNNKTESAFETLSNLIKIKKKYDWNEISHYWTYILFLKDIDIISNFVKFLNLKHCKEINIDKIQCDSNDEYSQIMLNYKEIIEENVQQLYNSFIENDDKSNFNSDKIISINIYEEMFYTTLFINDYKFSLSLIKYLKEHLIINDKEFISFDACDYFVTKRYQIFLELIDSLYQNIISVSICDTHPDSVQGNLIKFGSRFSQTIYSFIPIANFTFEEKDIVLIQIDSKYIIGLINSLDNKIKILSSESNLDGKDCVIIKILNINCFFKIFKAIRVITTRSCCDDVIQKIIFNKEKANFKEMQENNLIQTPINCNTLNPSQIEAIKKALNNKLTLIQGPPGTGKTTTAVKIIIEWLRYNNKKILVCADSNLALDNLYRELKAANVKSLRLGIKSEDELFSNNFYLKRYGVVKKAIDDCNVICTTCIGSMSELIKDNVFKRVIIDESTQSTEINSIVPLIKGAEQLVLIGDHKQLPPTVISVNASTQGLSVSLFERLINSNNITPVMLNVQYRMNPILSLFPSMHFYDSMIIDGVDEDIRPIIKGFEWPNKNGGIAYINVEGCEVKENNSYYNNQESMIVVDIFNNFILNGHIDSKDIGIITPYEAQKRSIKRIMMEYISINVNVDTVDGFQGTEKELIIFSAVRSNASSSLGFLKDSRRLNVMLTRARRGLIVIGNRKTLEKDKNWSVWLDWIREKNLEINRFMN